MWCFKPFGASGPKQVFLQSESANCLIAVNLGPKFTLTSEIYRSEGYLLEDCSLQVQLN